ncbi:hypothetical protein Hanom_Chr07g00643911 [Helianthus anomalus]
MIKDSQEISSISYTMSSKSASKFGLSNIQDIVSPQSIKKELPATQSALETKGMSTRAKGAKGRSPLNPLKKFVEIQVLQGQYLADAEERILDLQSITAAKDKRITNLEKESKILQK